MSELCYCQYAFAAPHCRVQEIGPGVDPQYAVELLCEGPIAALISRVSLEQFAPERLAGQTAEDIQWLGKIAARHNDIICQAARTSAVLPLRLGTLFRSRESLQAMLVRCQPVVAKQLEQLGNRQEWGIKLYLERRHLESASGHADPPPPHFVAPPQTGTGYLAAKRAERDSRRELRAGMQQTVQNVERCLAGKAEHYCRVANLPSGLTGREEDMVFNAAFLLGSATQGSWLETVEQVAQDIQSKGLALEVSGPWPPYHFCPTLEP
jgi:hypothetical protein